MKDSLGDRQKTYENVNRNFLTRKVPVIIRVDGRCFSTFTRKLNKPFDQGFIDGMVYAATNLASEMQGFKLAYVQSDEVSFVLTDFDEIETEPWFDYNINKMVSISAARMSVDFVNTMLAPDDPRMSNPPIFDSRAFNVPKEDVANYFLFRTKDWSRNSLQMYARSFFSHKQLNKKNKDDIHEMLHKIGKNWTTDLDSQLKNGTFIYKSEETGGFMFDKEILPKYEFVNAIVEKVMPKEKGDEE